MKGNEYRNRKLREALADTASMIVGTNSSRMAATSVRASIASPEEEKEVEVNLVNARQ